MEIFVTMGGSKERVKREKERGRGGKERGGGREGEGVKRERQKERFVTMFE